MQCHLQNMLGYPASQDFNYDELFPFFRHPINNIGDPFVEGTAKDNCHKLEREVLKFWAELLRAPKDKWWGYVTNGGTEGNLYGLWLARECCPKGIVYYSEDTHYSIDKNLHFLKMPVKPAFPKKTELYAIKQFFGQAYKSEASELPNIFSNGIASSKSFGSGFLEYL